MGKKLKVSREVEQMTPIGKIFRNARLDQGYGTLEFSKMVGISHVTIGKLERGHLTNISLEVINKIAAGLDFTVEVAVLPVKLPR